MSTSPLAGTRVVITRAPHQSADLADAFRAAGAEIALLPLLDVGPPSDPAPLDRAAAEAPTWDWIALTSPNAVDAFLPRTLRSRAASALPPIAVVGPATARALREHGVEPQLEAPGRTAADLAEALVDRLAPHDRVLIPQADDARSDLEDGLRDAGFDVETVVAYGKALPEDAPARFAELFADRSFGRVTFTSPRIVRHFVELAGAAWPSRRGTLEAVSIGPVTSRELARQGVLWIDEAELPTPQAMVEAVVARLAEMNR